MLRRQALPELLATPAEAELQGPAREEHRSNVRQGPRVLRVAKPAADLRKFRFNTGEGLRAAYYVQDDPASYSSLKEHVRQIDLLFPEWLFVSRARRQAAGRNRSTTVPFDVVDARGVHDVDQQNKVKNVYSGAEGRHRNLSADEQLQHRQAGFRSRHR